MQHGDGDDEGEVEPVGHVDVRFLALHERAEEHQEIGDPDDGEPEIDIPFGLGIFAALGDAEQIAGGGQDDEQLVAPEHEPGEIAEGQLRAAGALDDIEAGADQRVAAKGEDHRRGVQRPQPAEIEPFEIGVQAGKASCRAMTTPTRKPATPQKTVAMAPALTTPSR